MSNNMAEEETDYDRMFIENIDLDGNDEIEQGNESSLPTTSSSTNSANAIGRAAAIGRGRKYIESAEAKLKKLEQQHIRAIERACLICNADSVWYTLSNQCRRNVDTILQAMKSEYPPKCMSWSQIDGFERNFAQWIRQDRDVLLARLEYIPGFEEEYAHEPYYMPKRFRGDQQVMLAIVSKNPWALQLCTKQLRADRDIVMAAIRHPRFHFAPTMLQFAAPKLQADKRIARVALGQDYGIRAFPFLAPKLQEDRKLALWAIRKSSDEYSQHNEHLAELPEFLRDDEDVVLAAVKRNGLNLGLVTDTSLLADEDICRAAVSNCGGAAAFIPEESLIRYMMLRGNQLMTILTNGGGHMLEAADEQYRNNPQFLLAAVQNGYSPHKIATKLLDSNPDLFLELMRQSNSLGEFIAALPHDVITRPEVIQAVLESVSLDDSVMSYIVGKCPALFRNRAVMLDAIQRGCLDFLLHSKADELVEDATFMQEACQMDGNCLIFAGLGICTNKACLTAALSSGKLSLSTALAVIPSSMLRDAQVVALAIQQFGEDDDCAKLRHALPQSVYQNRDVMKACIEAKWPLSWIPNSHRFLFGDEEEIVLAAIKAGWSVETGWVGYRLLADRDFLRRAILLDSRVLSRAAFRLRWDYDLILLAVGSDRGALQYFSHRDSVLTVPCLVDFATKCREKLAVSETFVLEFLRGVSGRDTLGDNAEEETVSDPPPRKCRKRSCSSKKPTMKNPPAPRCHLPKLDCGYETGTSLKKLIAEYAGVCLGEEYKLMRQASANLAFWGY